MRPFLAVAGLLLALALAAWIFLRPAPGPVVEAGSPALPAAAESPAAVEPPAAAGTWRGPEAVVPPGGIERSDSVTPSDDSVSFLVRVIEDESGKPIPFAEVFYASDVSAQSQAAESLMGELYEVDALIETLAVRHLAGEDGTVRLPFPNESTWVAARTNERFGVGDVEKDSPAVLEIRCEKSITVAARVVDGAGRPQQDVRVELCVAESSSLVPILAHLSDPIGVARFRRLEILARDQREDARFLLAIAGLFGPPVAVELDWDALPAAPVDLVLPGFGSVELHVVDEEGKPVEDAVVASLSVVSEDDSYDAERLSQELSSFVTDGVARFESVGTGVQLRARAERADESLIGVVIGAGPRAAGETALLELRAGSGATFLVGRLFGLDGKPLANAQLKLNRNGGGGDIFDPFGGVDLNFSESSLRTNAAGRFRLELERSELQAGDSETITLRQSLQSANGAEASAILVGPLPMGEVDLGDLRLSQMPLIAAGLVMDEAGTPLAGIEIEVYGIEPNGQVNQGSSPQHGTVWSGKDGSFELRGESAREKFQVSARVEGYWCEGETVARGQTGVKIVMRRGGTLSGHVIPEEATNTAEIHLHLMRQDPGQWALESHWASLDENGDFSIAAIQPGLYQLSISSESASIPLLVLDNLQVNADEECTDPRLNPIDLRGRTRNLLVRAVDANGIPIESFVVTVLTGSSKTHLPAFGENGELSLPLPLEPVDLVVSAHGCLRVVLHAVTQDQTVTLRPGPKVRFLISNPEVLPPESHLYLTLESVADGELNLGDAGSAFMDSDGNAFEDPEIRAFGTFSVRVLLILKPASSAFSSPHVMLESRLGPIVVRDVEGLQTIPLTLSAEAVANAVASLKE